MLAKSLVDSRWKWRSVLPALTIMAMLVALPPGMSHADNVDVSLEASAFQKPMPDGTNVWMWGFASGGAPTVPGPRINALAGDTLNITLTNRLPVPISFVIPGQSITPSPTFVGGRVMSFTTEIPAYSGTGTPPSATYTWSNLKAGCYLYQSGTNPAVQVQMGLYGALTVDSAAGFAYPGKDYAAEALLLFSEVDPDLHQAIANGNYIDIPASVPTPVPGPQVTSTIDYWPRYFLINGEGHPNPIPGLAGPFSAGQKILIRMLNAGLQTHVPTFLGTHISLIAEDGNPYTYAKEQYAVQLSAGKTIDAIFTPGTPGDYLVFDRKLNTTNAGASPGGMIAKLTIGAAVAPPVANNDSYSTFKNIALTVAAPGVLGNDTNPSANPLLAVLVSGPTSGTLTCGAAPGLCSNGSFTYTPLPGFSGPVTFQYKANNGADSNIATVSITVINNDPPVANNDPNYMVNEDTTLTVAAPGVLGNDTDPNAGTVLSAFLVSGPLNGTLTLNSNGSFTYKGKANFNGIDTFTYKANDGMQDSNVATVTITINPVNDPPVALDNVAAVGRNSANVFIDLVSNDYVIDAGTTINGNSITITTPPNRGGTATPVLNGVNYTPPTGFTGTEIFYYKVADSRGVLSNAAKVTLNVVAPPTITSTPVTTATVGVLYNYDVNASSPSGATLTYSLTTFPAGMTINSATGLIQWIPTAAQAPSQAVTVQVTEPSGLSVQQSFTITVLAPPTITSTPVLTATVGVAYSYDVNATDPNPGDTLTYSLVAPVPAGMTINSGTGMIAWTPTAAQAPSQNVTVRVTDQTGLFATQSFTITVLAPPTITSTPVLTATVGVAYGYDVNATDPNPGDTLTYSLTTFPTGMTINSATGVIAWTPTAGQVPSQNVIVRVTDQTGLFASQSFTITVTPAVSDLIFQDGFESGNFSAWSAEVDGENDLNVTAAAALVGTRGMAALIDNNTSMYVRDDTPNNEPRYRARFYFDPNSITISNGNAHLIMVARNNANDVVRIEFGRNGGVYQVRAGTRLDNGNYTNTSWYTISDASHYIEFDWMASTAAGNNNGYLSLWIDGTLRQTLINLNNDTLRIEQARLGPLSGIDGGTRGTTYFDAFVSRRSTYIGP